MKILHRESILSADGLACIDGPIANHCYKSIPHPIRTGIVRDGVVFRAKEVERFYLAFTWATNTESALMNIIEELSKNYDEAKNLWSNYDDDLKKFRSQVKNDVSSLEASAKKTTAATIKMKQAYGDVMTLLNSHEMAAAIENAERLARAMDALASLQSHKLVFSVGENEQV